MKYPRRGMKVYCHKMNIIMIMSAIAPLHIQQINYRHQHLKGLESKN